MFRSIAVIVLGVPLLVSCSSIPNNNIEYGPSEEVSVEALKSELLSLVDEIANLNDDVVARSEELVAFRAALISELYSEKILSETSSFSDLQKYKFKCESVKKHLEKIRDEFILEFNICNEGFMGVGPFQWEAK